MTDAEREVIEYYNKGYTRADIYLFTSYSREQIRDILKNNKDNINRQKAIRGNRAVLLNAIESGITDIRVLQEMTGLSKATIYTYTNVGRRKPHYNHGHTADIVADLKAGQMTQSEIARKYGVSRQAVHKAKKYV